MSKGQFEGLTYLRTQDLGPCKHLEMHPGQRLNIITGDNGLGKTFLLEVLWFALTGQQSKEFQNWFPKSAEKPEIDATWTLQGVSNTFGFHFHFNEFQWVSGIKTPFHFGISTPARLVTKAFLPGKHGIFDQNRIEKDPSYSNTYVWDPRTPENAIKVGGIQKPSDFPPQHVSSDLLRENFGIYDVYEGNKYLLEIPTPSGMWNEVKNEEGTKVMNGIINDVALWQYNPNYSKMKTLFDQVLAALSPPDSQRKLSVVGTEPVGDDVQEIPQIDSGYEVVPITLLSAGMKRVVELAYLLVWTWSEHIKRCERRKLSQSTSLVLLIDEIEAHLHPAWQKRIVAALMAAVKCLSSELSVQVFLTTHSPVVLTSLEDYFDSEQDKLWHFDIDKTSREVMFGELQFRQYGTVLNWQESEAFDSVPGRTAGKVEFLNRINKFMVEAKRKKPTDQKILDLENEMEEKLGKHEEIWISWRVFRRLMDSQP